MNWFAFDAVMARLGAAPARSRSPKMTTRTAPRRAERDAEDCEQVLHLLLLLPERER